MDNFTQMSMLEIATILMEKKKNPQSIRKLISEVLEVKGYEDTTGQISAQLYIDITTSSKFVYMGNEEWDLKIRQSLDEYDKDGAAFNTKEDLAEAERELSAVLPVDTFDDEDEEDEDEDEVVTSTKDDSSEDSNDEGSNEEITYVEDSEDDEDEDEEEELRYIESDGDYMDEEKYNDYMDSYEDLYDE